MRSMQRYATIAVLMLPVGAMVAARASDADVSVQIELTAPNGNPEDALWLAYLTSRAAYIDRNKPAYEGKRGVITPLFAEELAARTDAVQIYRELKQKDAHLDVAYFADLSRVADHSFMGEYVWTYLYQPEWGTPPDNLHLVDFMAWRAANLTRHAGLTRGDIRLTAKEGAPKESVRTTSSEISALTRGVEVLRRGDAQSAIAGYFDPVIEYFERLHTDAGRRFYSARNQMQVLLYATLPNDEKKEVVVLDYSWADAYLMKAYALTEMRNLAAAQTALERAIALSPLSSQYLSELAYVFQAQGACDRSIATYQQAESVAELGSEESTKTADLTLAWRGQGYCLVELGRFDEAVKLYKKCLALDPSDKKAKGELEYIKSKR